MVSDDCPRTQDCPIWILLVIMMAIATVITALIPAVTYRGYVSPGVILLWLAVG